MNKTFHKLLKLQQINGKKHKVMVIETARHTKSGENAPNRPWH